MDPTTQGTQAEAQGSDQQSNQNDQGATTIPMDRFNEVIAKANKLAEGIESQQGVIAQQQATIAQLQAQMVNVNRPPEPVAPEIDPEDQKKIDYYVGRALTPVLNELKSLKANIGQARAEPQIDKVEQRLAQINNPAVTARTRELIRDLKARGELGSLYTADEALKVALGEFALGQLSQNQQNRQEQAQYNGGGVVPMGQMGGGQKPKPGARPVTAGVTKPLEDMSMQELEQYVNEQQTKYPEGVPF